MAWSLPNRYFEEFPKAKTTKMTRNKRKMKRMRKTKEKAIQSEYPALRPCGETEIGDLIERHAQPVRNSKGSPSEPFPSITLGVRLFGSRLRGRAVQTSVPRLERVWGVLFLHRVVP